MKTLNILLISIVLVVFSACSSDESEDLILGNWDLEKVNYEGESLTSFFNSSKITTFVDGQSKYANFKWVFHEGKIASQGNYELELEFSTDTIVNSHDIKFKSDFVGSYLLEEDLLTINNDDKITEYSILELTRNTLVVNSFFTESSKTETIARTSSRNVRFTFTR